MEPIFFSRKQLDDLFFKKNHFPLFVCFFFRSFIKSDFHLPPRNRAQARMRETWW